LTLIQRPNVNIELFWNNATLSSYSRQTYWSCKISN